MAVLAWVTHRWQHANAHMDVDDAVACLQRVEAGTRFACVEYSLVLSQALNALGIPARRLWFAADRLPRGLGTCTRGVGGVDRRFGLLGGPGRTERPVLDRNGRQALGRRRTAACRPLGGERSRSGEDRRSAATRSRQCPSRRPRRRRVRLAEVLRPRHLHRRHLGAGRLRSGLPTRAAGHFRAPGAPAGRPLPRPVRDRRADRPRWRPPRTAADRRPPVRAWLLRRRPTPARRRADLGPAPRRTPGGADRTHRLRRLPPKTRCYRVARLEDAAPRTRTTR